jgi:uncharacterized protein
MARRRIVLDTNVLVQGIAYPESIPGRILRAWKEGAVSLVLSRFILDEMTRMLARLKRVALTAAEIEDLADSFHFMAEIAEPVATGEEALRDHADEPVLGPLVAGKADYLVTEDKNLLALTGRWPILTRAEFWLRHGG